MSLKHILPLFLLSLCIACSPKAHDNQDTTMESRELAAAPSPKSKLPLRLNQNIAFAWATPSNFDTPESVLFDKERNVLYVSNISGFSTAKNHKGYISKVDPDNGLVLSEKWISTLNAPKGMALLNNTLYVSDIDQLVTIDIPSGKILERIPTNDSALFFNDVAIDAQGKVYVSDSRTHTIFRFDGTLLQAWVQDSLIFIPNGLAIRGNTLLCGVENKVLSIDLNTKKIEILIEDAGTGRVTDGLVSDGQDAYFISNWEGLVLMVQSGRNPIRLLDGSTDGINTADLEYAQEKQLLYIPTFEDNRVIAYRWTPEEN